MGKCMNFIVYVLAAIGFMVVGALIAGLSVYFTFSEDCPSSFIPKAEIHAECVLEPSAGNNVDGILFFHQEVGSTIVGIDGNVTGLATGLHGFHIHTYGVTGGDCAIAEGHYNPNGFDHASPTASQRHVGDLGNIESLDDGIAYVQIVDEVISLYGEKSIIGRSVVVHELQDDLGLGGDDGSITTGNAGARLACCTIFLTPH